MKNKHLVLLFLLTLLIGLAVRRAPWVNAKFFQASLLRADTAVVRRMEFGLPGAPGLVLVRDDAGWVAEQQNRSARVPPELAQTMLAALADLRSVRIVKTARPDTLGFGPATAIDMGIYYAHAPTEHLNIGWETIENGQPATFVRLPRHDGIYLAESQLRAIFSKTLADFRKAAVIRFNPAEVRHISIFGQGVDSLLCQKNHAAGNWSLATRAVPDDSVQRWLSNIVQLEKLPFTDLFDESHAHKTFFAQIDLELERQTEPFTVKIFRLGAANLPEELPDGPLDPKQFAPYVLYFSHYPTNYYALSDTALLRRICQPF